MQRESSVLSATMMSTDVRQAGITFFPSFFIIHLSGFSFYINFVGLDLGVTSRDPRFVGSNAAEIDGFLQNIKLLNTSLPGGTLSLRFRAR